jgi:hypothetical protein
MKWLKKYSLFKESKQEVTSIYNNKNLIEEICVSMILLNNEFLDHILDKGLSARYSENSSVFITDLKNLLLAKNRLHLGNFNSEGRCVVDNELSKVNNAFTNIEFTIKDNWDKLVNSRITARNIIDKLIPDEKLTSDRISFIYWIGPNKTKEYSEDIVIETTDGKQFSFFLNKNLSSSKSSSFNTFADIIIGENLDKLYQEEYLRKWDKLTSEWVRIIYENANKNIQQHIEKFIDPKRIDTLSYFEYFDIKHRDPRFKHLGEYMREFEKNILKFSDLLNEIWKNKTVCLNNIDEVLKTWTETKVVILNSKILENILTTSLKSEHSDDIIKLENGLKQANGNVKMKLFKTLVEKLGCLERSVYFLGNNGNSFVQVPERDFFRKFYDDLNLKFDYHVKFTISDEEENNDFKMLITLDLEDEKLLDMLIIIKPTGGELSNKLTAKYKFDISEKFNYLVSKALLKNNENHEN